MLFTTQLVGLREHLPILSDIYGGIITYVVPYCQFIKMLGLSCIIDSAILVVPNNETVCQQIDKAIGLVTQIKTSNNELATNLALSLINSRTNGSIRHS